MQSKVIIAGLALVAAGLAGSAAAQGNFPNKPIRLVVPYGAGGGPDVLSRTLSQKVSESTGQPVIVDNRPGAGGIVAAEIVQKAAPDGYTLFVADTGHLGISPTLIPKLPYDPLKDFTPVILAVSTPLFLATSTSYPFETVKQFIDYAKAKPGLPYGSSGNGSAHHLTMEWFRSMAGINLTHIPYKGVAQSVPALVSGDVAAIFVALPSIAAHVQSGKVRILGVALRERTKLRPDAPPIADTLPGFDVNLTIGIMAPAGTPRDVVQTLYGQFAKAVHAPDVAQRFAALGIVPEAGTPEQYAALIKADQQKFAKMIKDTGARVD
jgi:tripartite-type tricarboxylate transporter receptor subunit TctC